MKELVLDKYDQSTNQYIEKRKEIRSILENQNYIVNNLIYLLLNKQNYSTLTNNEINLFVEIIKDEIIRDLSQIEFLFKVKFAEDFEDSFRFSIVYKELTLITIDMRLLEWQSVIESKEKEIWKTVYQAEEISEKKETKRKRKEFLESEVNDYLIKKERKVSVIYSSIKNMFGINSEKELTWYESQLETIEQLNLEIAECDEKIAELEKQYNQNEKYIVVEKWESLLGVKEYIETMIYEVTQQKIITH